jgi:ribonuclease P protein subunit POP4
MSITPQNLVRHELIGLKVKIATSTDKTQKGLQGTVVDETYNMLKIETKEETKKGKKVEDKLVSKQNNVFIFTLPNKVKVQVDGKLLVSRPEDRIKKKFAKW